MEDDDLVFEVVEIDGVLFPKIDKEINWNFSETWQCYVENPYKLGFHKKENE